MSSRTRRYLFAAYREIEYLDFEHLEKVCDRLFILVPEKTESVPFGLVRRLQRMGKGVKWIPVSEADNLNLPLQLSFLMGRLHQKLPADIEFAILSDDAAFDPLIQFIFEKNRPCLRIRASNRAHEEAPAPKPTAKLPFLQPLPPQPQAAPPMVVTQFSKINQGNGEEAQTVRFAPADAPVDESSVREAAHEVVERLLRSGNRPAEVATLRQYIGLVNHHMPPTAAERVITFMAMNNNIEIRDKEVVYHF